MDPNHIRFRCPACGNAIAGPGTAAGKTVRCPHKDCGAKMVVPYPPTESAHFGSQEMPQESNALARQSNLYHSPCPGPFTDDDAEQAATPAKLKAPAIGLIVVGALDALCSILNLLSHLGPVGPMPAAVGRNEIMRELWRSANEQNPIVGAIFSVFTGLIAAVIIFGGVQMQRQKSYRLAIAASALSAMPCVTCLGCCGVGQAVGLWAFVILLTEDVRSSFS